MAPPTSTPEIPTTTPVDLDCDCPCHPLDEHCEACCTVVSGLCSDCRYYAALTTVGAER